MRELIKRICGRLTGINYEDLTTAERQIVDLLIAHDYLTRNDKGDIEDTDDKPRKRRKPRKAKAMAV